MQNFEKLEIWNHGMCSQLKRAAASVTSNIAEGSIRQYNKAIKR